MATTDGITIGELASLSGVTRETIRYYERELLIPPGKRVGSGNYRRFSRADADRLRFVRRARDLGFSLEDVRGLLALAAAEPTEPCGDVDQIARAHIAQIDDKLARLTTLRNTLSRLIAGCDSSSEISQCSLLTALSGE